MATHFSILAWKIPWTEEPGRLQSMDSQELDTTEWLSHSQGGCPFTLPVSSLLHSPPQGFYSHCSTKPALINITTDCRMPNPSAPSLRHATLSSSTWHSGSSALFQRLSSLDFNLTFLLSDWSLLLSLWANSSSSSTSFLWLLNAGSSQVSNHRPNFSAYTQSLGDSSKSHSYKYYIDAEDLPHNSRLPTAHWTSPCGDWTSISNLTCLKSKLPIVLSSLSLSHTHRCTPDPPEVFPSSCPSPIPQNHPCLSSFTLKDDARGTKLEKWREAYW